MPKDKPATDVAKTFCRAYLGRDCFAPFTGQDASGWRAFVYLIEMWGRSDHVGQDSAILAMRSVLLGVQNKECVLQVFVQSISAILDWGHVDQIWPQLLTQARVGWDLTAVRQVTEEHRRKEEREDRRTRERTARS